MVIRYPEARDSRDLAPIHFYHEAGDGRGPIKLWCTHCDVQLPIANKDHGWCVMVVHHEAHMDSWARQYQESKQCAWCGKETGTLIQVKGGDWIHEFNCHGNLLTQLERR